MKKLLLLLPALLLVSCGQDNAKKVSNYFKEHGDMYFDDYGKVVYYFSYSQYYDSDEVEYSMYYSESRSLYRMVCGFGASDQSDWGASYVDFYSWGDFDNGNFNYDFSVGKKDVLKIAYSEVTVVSGTISEDTKYYVTLNEGISDTDSSAKSGIYLLNRGIAFFDHWVGEIKLPSFRR